MILFIYIFNFLSMVFGVGVGWTTDYLLSVTVYHYYLLFILNILCISVGSRKVFTVDTVDECGRFIWLRLLVLTRTSKRDDFSYFYLIKCTNIQLYNLNQPRSHSLPRHHHHIQILSGRHPLPPPIRFPCRRHLRPIHFHIFFFYHHIILSLHQLI